MTEHCYYFWNGVSWTENEDIHLKRYLLHGKQYVSGHAAGTRGLALEAQISWRISSATEGETLGSFFCCLFCIFKCHVMSSNQRVLNSEVSSPVV